MTYNPYAIYINCDGAMDYDSKSTGGIGYVVSFPDSIKLDSILVSIGKYIGANIERLELEAIIQGMEEILKLSKTRFYEIKKANQIIIVTDRYGLHDQEKTNPYRINEWRKNNWCNFEGKPIKNSDLLDKLDKTRKKINNTLHCRVSIEYQRRKKNRIADKLSKAGKEHPQIKDNIAIKGSKISRRLFNGVNVDYKRIHEKENYIVHIYRKEPVRDQWEIFCEICKGLFIGRIMKIYADDVLASKLQRQHIYEIRVKRILRFNVEIYRSVKEIKNKSRILGSTNE